MNTFVMPYIYTYFGITCGDHHSLIYIYIHIYIYIYINCWRIVSHWVMCAIFGWVTPVPFSGMSDVLYTHGPRMPDAYIRCMHVYIYIYIRISTRKCIDSLLRQRKISMYIYIYIRVHANVQTLSYAHAKT